MEYSRQCILEKPLTKEGVLRQVSWIPEAFAKIGKFLRLRENDVWENGWQVVQVGGRQSKQERIDRGNDHKKQRRASDI